MAQLLTKDEFNDKLNWLKTCGARILKQGPGRGTKKHRKTCDIFEAFIEEKPKELELVMKEPGSQRASTYLFFLDGDTHYEETVVPIAVREFYKYYKPPFISSSVGTTAGIRGYNKKYNGTRNYAYEYDINSSYSSALLGDMPETSNNLGPKIVEKDELGYNRCLTEDGSFILEKVEQGEQAQYVFKRMPSPYKEYVAKYYNIKKNSTGDEKAKAKAFLNVVIGNLQNQNPFLRAEVVCVANKIIADLIDENTIYWNTDSIVSLVRRPDIEKNLGVEIGQWKLDKEGQFAYVGCNYQWNDENAHIGGIPQVWTRGIKYDLLTDGTPIRRNPYIFDWEKQEIKENEGY